MTYGRLGPSGYQMLGQMAQARSAPPGGLDSLPRTVTPTPTPDPERVESRSSPVEDMARLLDERDSNSRGDELSNKPGGVFGGGLPDMIAAEPGSFGMFGLSHGSGYDALGRAYDTLNFNPAALAGGLVGGAIGGPIAGTVGGFLGSQADLNYPLSGGRARGRDFGRGGVGQMSRGERAAFEEARNAVMSRPMPQNLTSTERALRQAALERDSQSRGSELSGSSSAGGKGVQSVSGATRGPSGMGSRGGAEHRGYGDRGRWG